MNLARLKWQASRSVPAGQADQGQTQAGPSSRQAQEGGQPILPQTGQRVQNEQDAATGLILSRKLQRRRLAQGQGEHAAEGSTSGSSSSAATAPTADAAAGEPSVAAALAAGPLGVQPMLDLFQLQGPVTPAAGAAVSAAAAVHAVHQREPLRAAAVPGPCRPVPRSRQAPGGAGGCCHCSVHGARLLFCGVHQRDGQAGAGGSQGK